MTDERACNPDPSVAIMLWLPPGLTSDYRTRGKSE
ncbi:hypothetical protein FOQG_00559 [Fusarium oxysporum f. sp. raphani 54005]|uniref:Uncharacterized protein n=5 Tax=Fusarium oxysporum TaxID=5507 RepID=X0D9W8_FUSOX|nr:hypothetical protein FOXG_18183 [Fusarium oxysporum f. sp. lycopersici 4287]EXA50209.1 hypothetical protein FOVG_03018 [Fusarium oxysporum f. sp. pisi HDV247]EXK42314.1 hypothetical protein FOMG_05323 [Fusarium oxysporum f. sp. melonis 26406]EXL00349.1 hypothetical protein FOQG_00559 [Fusarium oxysporum f. sp. raphani 54005]EXL67546.1 hypothetical protein FOPG_16336 [Fusarium oxysporum f. sp. conglutinans race 2 54008]KAI8414962.1 hypothetical protein FOFC_04581 [Fusarium oxysporum]